MPRATDFDLASELAKPSFTPDARAAPALVELIVAGDEPAATRAAAALARVGAAARAAVEARFTDSADIAEGGNARGPVDEGARARLVAVLGLLARGGDDAA